MEVRNVGAVPAFWIDLRRASPSSRDPVVLYPPPTTALAGWKELTGKDDPMGNRLDRILVYATVERDSSLALSSASPHPDKPQILGERC